MKALLDSLIWLLFAAFLASCSQNQLPIEDADTIGDAGDADGTDDSDLADGSDGDSDEYIVEYRFFEECDHGSPEGLAGCIDSARYREDLEFIGQDRFPGSAHWQAVQDLCASRLEELGYTVERHTFSTGVNVIGTMEGLSAPAEQVIASAHYDHIQNCPGANDNASGVAGLLEIARVFSDSQFSRTLKIICWDQEEIGQTGSNEYADQALARGDQIVAMFNYDSIGYTDHDPNTQTLPDGIELLAPDLVERLEENENRANFFVILSDEASRDTAALIFEYSERINILSGVLEVPEIVIDSEMTADLRRSDHGSFWRVDYPAMFITDTSELRDPAYHCVEEPDTADRLDDEFTRALLQSTVGALSETLVLL